MLTHVKELIEQNAEKMLHHWPDAPLGIYSASIGKKQIDHITFAGIQSIRNKADQLGHVDLVIIDECHLVSHKDEGSYRTLLSALSYINPSLRVVGLTATPYRLGHGLITDKPALFDALIEPVSIEELVHKGYLAPLRSKVTSAKLDVSGVHKRGGEYIEAELQKAVNTDKNNLAVVQEVIRLAEDRKAWLFFCAGVDHAKMVAFVLDFIHGIPAACITGETPKAERERIIADFKAGKLRALTNANVLTTGFDYPDIDLIAMLRPTMSASLYVQMAGRGMRPKSHTDHCLVLDFAGVVATHGPITAVVPPRKGGDGSGDAPVKVCDSCGELVALSAKVCPACGTPFPERKPKKLKLHDDDIMGLEGKTLHVQSWAWRVQMAQSGKKMLVVSYYGGLSDPVVREYLTVLHEGIAGGKARNTVSKYLLWSNVTPSDNLEETASRLSAAQPPARIEYKMDGKFFRVLRRSYAGKAAEDCN
jgi:DNA repair protein RadD